MPFIQPLQTLLLDKQPCCLEVCPYRPDLLLVGTYNLLDDDISNDKEEANKSQNRNGSLELFMFQNGQLETLSPALDLGYGVLDIHYEPDTDHFGIATSSGLISLFRISHEDDNQSSDTLIEHLQSFRIANLDTVLTCFAWNPKKAGQIVAGASSGSVFFVELPLHDLNKDAKSQDEMPTQLQPLLSYCHREACWTVCFSKLAGGLYSGGDDNKLIFTRYTACDHDTADASTNGLFADVKTSTESTENDSMDQRQYCDSHGHKAGVTAVVPLDNSFIKISADGYELVEFLATGSYDERLRIVMVQHFREKRYQYEPELRFTELLHLSLGNGAWRFKVITQGLVKSEGKTNYIAYILVSCMQAGARIIEVRSVHGFGTECSWEGHIVASCQNHGSLCYDTAFYHGYGGEPIPTDNGPGGFQRPWEVSQSGRTDLELSESNVLEKYSRNPSFEEYSQLPKGPWSRSVIRRIVTCSFYDKKLCVSPFHKILPYLEEADVKSASE